MHTITPVISHVNPRAPRTDAHAARIARHRESRRLARRRARLARTILREQARLELARRAGLRPSLGVGELREILRVQDTDFLAWRRARIGEGVDLYCGRLAMIVESSPCAFFPTDDARDGWVYDGDSLATYERVVSLRGGR